MKKAYTFDDLLLVPNKSEVTPSEVSIKSRLTKKIPLNLPIISAAMDTVTEYEMAISMARCGGIGIIHKNMSIQEQARQVDLVKKSQSGMILDPITLRPGATTREAESILRMYKISGLPIVDEDNKLLGIITNRDLKYLRETDELVENVMTIDNLVTAKLGTTLDEAKQILWAHRIEKLPIVSEDNTLLGLITSKDIDNVLDYPNANKDEHGRLVVGAALSVGEDLLERAKALVKSQVDVVVLDSAHAHSKNVINALKTLKKHYPNLPVVVGNLVTKEAAEALIENGADALKVGIGPGSICTTRVISGVGMPQLSAIKEVYDVAKLHDIPVIADGGIKYSGDIVKALAIGASSVMLGSLLAGTEEAPGETILFEGRTYKTYVGMGSLAAMKRGSSDRYFQNPSDKFVPEGIEGMVPYKGLVSETLYQLEGGIRSGMGYLGAKNLSKLVKNAKFVEISPSGLIESHPHNVKVTKEAPNYQRK